MADTSVVRPGVPSWVDLSSSDLEAAKHFYHQLFGWTAHVVSEPEAGGYTLFYTDGKSVAGASPLMDPQQPVAWTTYVSVDDAAATAARATDAGGEILAGPMDVMDQGRMAIIKDPTGAVFGVWQPGAHKGADVFNEPGALSWNELATRDVPEAAQFYTKVFGWGAASGEAMGGYTEWKLGDRTVAGMMKLPDDVPASVPAYWLPYFAVADHATVVKRTAELGGRVMVQPTKIPHGTFAVLRDPQGAVFGVIEPAAA